MKRSITLFCTLLLLIVSAVPALASKVLSDIEYFYSDDGTLIGKAFNGKRVNFEYDLRGQLLAVKDAYGNDLERYTYDPAGNRLSKTINGVTTAYTYDKANQLVTSTVNGVTTHYKYDAAGRMIQAGDKKYIYNGNNKVVAIWQNGDIIAKFEYNIDGQISKAIYGDKVEEFMWDGLALIWRSGVTYINEPYVTGGNPVMAGDNVLFNDMLGSTLAINGKAVEMTSFGETADKNAFFTGKPMIDELGYFFLFRDYNPNQGKWTTSDPLGYPDGWNNLAYCNNKALICYDKYGLSEWFQGSQAPVVGRVGLKTQNNWINLEPGGWMTSPFEKYVPNFHRTGDVHDAWVDALILYGVPDLIANVPTMVPAFIYALGLNLYEDGSLALEYIVDTGTDVYEWNKEITGNYLIDPLSNLIGDFLNNVSSTFSSVYNLITPNGRPE